MTTIKNLLKGKDQEAQNQLDLLMNSIGKNPKILWYPSAGNDYRDIIELCTNRSRDHGIKEKPDLFIHTDYSTNPDLVKLYGIAYQDNKTTVSIESSFQLALINPINYYVDPGFVIFSDQALKIPTIYLLNISINSNSLGSIKKQVIYFLFENINFLDEVILKNRIPISHIVKVREGCGFGGNRKSISIAYAFLSVLKTKYLLIDNEEHTDFHIIDKLKWNHGLLLKKYSLTKLCSIDPWSGFYVNVFQTAFPDKNDYYSEMTKDDLDSILQTIKEGNKLLWHISC